MSHAPSHRGKLGAVSEDGKALPGGRQQASRPTSQVSGCAGKANEISATCTRQIEVK